MGSRISVVNTRRRESQQSSNTLQDYINQLEDAYNAALAANIKSRDEGTRLYDEIITQAKEYGTGQLEELERVKKESVASGMQSLVSAGLANTTRAASLERKFEETAGSKARSEIQAEKTRNLQTALAQKAGFIERIENTYPDYGTIAQLILQASR